MIEPRLSIPPIRMASCESTREGAMLRDRDKTRIRAEETFRAEVRASLEPPRTLLGRLNKFLATPVGTLLVSTFIAGGISWAYNEVKIDMEIERKEFDAVVRLDNEISWRVQQFIVAFQTFQSRQGALENFERPQGVFYLFSEYKERPTSSLLRELHDLVGEKESGAIKTAYNSVIYVRYTRLKNQVNGDGAVKGQIASHRTNYSVAPIAGSDSKADANQNCMLEKPETDGTTSLDKKESDYRSVCNEIFKAFNQERWNHPFDADYANLSTYRLIKSKPNNPGDGIFTYLKTIWRRIFT